MVPICSKDKELEKWSPNREGPFKVHQVLPGNAYLLSSLEDIKGSSMGSTLRNTFPQCGKCWTLLRKTKVGNEGIATKIGLIDHFWIGETIHSSYFVR